jgi:hypothetical protein
MTHRHPSLNRWLTSAVFGLAALAALPAGATDVGVSIAFSQPGVYGRVDIGRYPEPVLVAPRPVVISRAADVQPVYLWAPPEHRRDWRRHCRHYGACGAPVYFVDDGWYRRTVVVRRDDNHGHRHGQPQHHPHHRPHDRDRDDGHGHGKGHGHGHRD